MKTGSSSETLVTHYQSIKRNMLDGFSLHRQLCQNIKSRRI